MWDEVKGYVTLFIIIPLAFGMVYYVGYRLTTGNWPNPPMASNCYTEWDGISNPEVCD